MTVYVALLRGINVGGKNRIQMAKLKRMFEEMGLNRVQTYIQSGNVIFESEEKEMPLLKRIEHELEATFGFAVTVIIRAASELDGLIGNCPFSEEEIAEAEALSEVESLYVAFLAQAPSEEGIQRLNAYSTENDRFQINERDVYLLFHHSIRQSKLANNLHKLDVPTTVRNWKTINKLAALAKAMEG